MPQNLYVLDDDPQYAELLVEIASKAGWTATFEQSAGSFLGSNLPKTGVLVLDIVMPEMDGIQVIRALAEKKSNLSLILISGFDSEVLHSAQQLAEDHNMTVLANLTKPIMVNDFIKLLNDIERDYELRLN